MTNYKKLENTETLFPKIMKILPITGWVVSSYRKYLSGERVKRVWIVNVRVLELRVAKSELEDNLPPKDEDGDVRKSVAGNRNTPPHVLESLSKDENLKVRGSVAENPNTPTNILEALSKDEHIDVRETATSALEELKYSSDWTIKR